MAAISPQGSRGGLITALVIFLIGFVASTIFAIYYAQALGESERIRAQDKKTSVNVYSGLDTPPIRELISTAGSDNNLQAKTALDEASAQLTALATAITPMASTTQPTLALHDAAVALDKAKDFTNNAGNLVDALDKLLEKVNELQDNLNSAKNASSDAEKAHKVEIDTLSKQIDAAKTGVDAAVAEAKKYQDQAAAVSAQCAQSLKDQSDVSRKDQEDFDKRLHDAETERAALQAKIDQQKKTLETVTTKLALRRVDTIEPIIRRPQGIITSLGEDDVVYINLGWGSQITTGMTFAVYDQHEGVPKLADGLSPDNMPVGEGSIEVQQIYKDGGSQCRVIHTEVGEHMHKGDLILNLVYDPNVKYNFVVFGKFDLSFNGTPNIPDGEKIKGLITQWGGNVQDPAKGQTSAVNVDTDFLVLGTEPVVHSLTEKERTDDPSRAAKELDEIADLAAYNKVLEEAKSLHIPVMNQNRFLYFIGYFNLTNR